MGQVEDMFEMSNQEAANILRNYMGGYLITCYGRGGGKTAMQLRQLRAFAKAIDLLEKTPDKSSHKNKTDDYVKLCPDCDGKSSHPSPILNGESKRQYDHFCLKCGRAWNECDDE